MNKFLLIIVAFFIFFYPVEINAEGKIYYVSFSQGRDTNNGTDPSFPYKTLSKVESLNLNGDTVKFRSGDIWNEENNKAFVFPESNNESSRNTITNYGSEYDPRPKLPRTYIGSNTDVSKIHFFYAGKNKNCHSCLVSAKKNIDFDNCLFENDNCGDTCLVVGSKNINFYKCTFIKGNDAGLNYHSTTDSKAEHCVATNNWINGIIAWNKSSNIIIRNCYVNSMSKLYGAGIEIGTFYPKNCVVSNNYITGNNYGMFITGSDHLIYNNIIYDENLRAGIWLSKIDSVCKNNKIINNTILSKGLGIAIKKDIKENNVVINNIIVSVQPRNFQVYCASPDTNNFLIDYNCYFSKNGFSAWWINYSISVFNIYKRLSGKDKYSIFEDPGFTSKTDLKLKENSPCIGRAKRVSEFTTDYFGNQRSDQWDIGAIQHKQN